ILVADPVERFFAGASPGSRSLEKSDDRGALSTAEARVASCDHIGCDSALPVCRTRKSDEAPLAGYEILYFHSISDSKDVRIAGLHLFVNPDTSAFPYL